MEKHFEKILTCPLQATAIFSTVQLYEMEDPKEALISLENQGIISAPELVGRVCRSLSIQYYPWYSISIKKTNSTFYQVTIWAEKNHVVNENAYPIEMPVSLLRCWADTNVGYDKVGPYLQMGEGERLYENNMVGKWIKEAIFNNVNPLRHCPIRLVKVDVDKARVRFEADITNIYREELPEPNGINAPDDWEQKMKERESDDMNMSI
jgi:hypothetical protein